MSRRWYNFKASATGAEIMLYDDIGESGVTAKDFANELKTYAGQPLTLRIHSNGGSVFDGLAIYNALKRHTGGLTVAVDGVAASMASIIMLAGQTISIAANGYVMVHAPSGLSWANAGEMRDTADTLEKFQGTMAAIYSARTGKSEAEVQGWMNKDTWFTADEALAAGLVDSISEEMKMAAKLDLSAFRGVPSKTAAFAKPRVKAAVKRPALTPEQNAALDAEIARRRGVPAAAAPTGPLIIGRAQFDKLTPFVKAKFFRDGGKLEHDAPHNEAAVAALAPPTATRAAFEAMKPAARETFFRNGGKLTN